MRNRPDRCNCPKDAMEHRVDCPAVPMTDPRARHRLEVAEDILAAGVHDLTTNLAHKRDVLAGAHDECTVIGRVLARRLLSPDPQPGERP